VPQTDGRAVGDGKLLLSRVVSRDRGGFAPCAPRDNMGERDAESLAGSSLEMLAQAAAIAPKLITNVAEENFPGGGSLPGRWRSARRKQSRYIIDADDLALCWSK